MAESSNYSGYSGSWADEMNKYFDDVINEPRFYDQDTNYTKLLQTEANMISFETEKISMLLNKMENLMKELEMQTDIVSKSNLGLHQIKHILSTIQILRSIRHDLFQATFHNFLKQENENFVFPKNPLTHGGFYLNDLRNDISKMVDDLKRKPDGLIFCNSKTLPRTSQKYIGPIITDFKVTRQNLFTESRSSTIPYKSLMEKYRYLIPLPCAYLVMHVKPDISFGVYLVKYDNVDTRKSHLPDRQTEIPFTEIRNLLHTYSVSDDSLIVRFLSNVKRFDNLEDVYKTFRKKHDNLMQVIQGSDASSEPPFFYIDQSINELYMHLNDRSVMGRISTTIVKYYQSMPPRHLKHALLSLLCYNNSAENPEGRHKNVCKFLKLLIQDLDSISKHILRSAFSTDLNSFKSAINEKHFINSDEHQRLNKICEMIQQEEFDIMSDFVFDKEVPKVFEGTSASLVEEGYSNLFNQVEKEKQDRIIQTKHIHQTNPSRHFLITSPNTDIIKTSGLVMSQMKIKLDDEVLKFYGVPNKSVVTLDQNNHVTNAKCIHDIVQTIKQIAIQAFFISKNRNSNNLENISINSKEIIHDCSSFNQLFSNDNFCLFDDQLAHASMGVVDILEQYVDLTSDVSKFMTQTTIIEYKYRNKTLIEKPSNILEKQKLKKDKAERKTLFNNCPKKGYYYYTGHQNTYKIRKNLTPYSSKNIKAFEDKIGFGQKQKSQEENDSIIKHIKNLKLSKESYKEQLQTSLDTSKEVIDPNCASCRRVINIISDCDLTMLPENQSTGIFERLEDLKGYYLDLEQIPGREFDVNDGFTLTPKQEIKETYEKLFSQSLVQSLYSTQQFFDSLFVLSKLSRSRNTFQILSKEEPGRFFIVPQQSDKNDGNITYLDMYISSVSPETSKILTKQNYDTSMIQFYNNGIYVCISKPFKLNSVRLDILSKVFYRFVLGMAGFSTSLCSFQINSKSFQNCLDISSCVTMSKLALFDLHRHQFNHCIATTTNFKKFMSEKFKYDCKTISDLRFLLLLKDWFLDICSKKELLNETNETDLNKNAPAFKSYVTGQNYMTFAQMINTVYGSIYFCPKELHNKSTNLMKLIEVPLELQEQFLETVKDEKVTQCINSTFPYTQKMHLGQTEYSYNNIILSSVQLNRYTDDENRSIRLSLNKNLDMSKSVTEAKTNASTKSSVNIESVTNSMKHFSESHFKLLKNAYRSVVNSSGMFGYYMLYQTILNILDQDLNSQVKNALETFKNNLRWSMVANYFEATYNVDVNEIKNFTKYSQLIESITDETLRNYSMSKKHSMPKNLQLFLGFSNCDSIVLCSTMPVQSNLYLTIKKVFPTYEGKTYADFINYIMSNENWKDFIPIISMFPKGQRTRQDREIYILDIFTKYLLLPIEQVFFTLNKSDPFEAISIAGDEKNQYLVKMENESKNIRRAFQEEQVKVNNPDMVYGDFATSVDQSKWSAKDVFAKFLQTVMNCNFLSMKDRLVMYSILQRYMLKEIKIDDGVFMRLFKEFLNSGVTFSVIQKATNDFKKNHCNVTFNWFQGVFNHMSSKVHSDAILALQRFWDNYINVIKTYEYERIKINAMVHSDDGAITFCYWLSKQTMEKIDKDFGNIEKCFMGSLLRTLRLFGIILNPTKTFIHPTIFDFISNYIIDREPLGPYMRGLVSLLAPLDHSSYLLDMKQLSGHLQSIAKCAPSALQAITGCFIGSQYVHGTYNMNTKHSLKIYKEMKKLLGVTKLPLSLFGPVSMPLELLAVSGLKANDPYLLMLEMSKAISLNPSSLIISELNTIDPKPYQIFKHLTIDDNFLKVNEYIDIIPASLKTLSLFVNSYSEDLDQDALNFLNSNTTLLRVPKRHRERLILTKLPHIYDVISQNLSSEKIAENLQSSVVKYYDLIDKPKSLEKFMNSMLISALKPKQYQTNTSFDTVTTRQNIKLDINKRFFHLGDIIHSIDQNSSAATFGVTRKQDVYDAAEKNIKQSVDSVTNYMKKMREAYRMENLKPLGEDLEFERIQMSLKWVSGNDQVIKNSILKSVFEKLLVKYDDKYSIAQSLPIISDIVKSIKDELIEKEWDISNSLKTFFHSNIVVLNNIAYSVHNTTNYSKRREKYSIAVYNPFDKTLSIRGDIETVLFNSMMDPEKNLITLLINREKIAVSFQDIMSTLKIDTYMDCCIETYPYISIDRAKCFQFNYSFLILCNVVKSFLSNLKQNKHYIYLRGQPRTTSQIICTLKGSYCNSKDTIIYNPSLSVSMNQNYGIFQIMAEVEQKATAKQLKASVAHFCNYFASIENIIKAFNFSNFSYKIIDFCNDIRPHYEALLMSRIGEFTIKEMLNDSRLKPEIDMFLEPIRNIHFNLGFTNDSTSFQDPESHEEWPDNEFGTHSVVSRKNNVLLIVNFDDKKIISTDYYGTIQDSDELFREAQELFCNIINAKLRKIDSFFENQKNTMPIKGFTIDIQKPNLKQSYRHSLAKITTDHKPYKHMEQFQKKTIYGIYNKGPGAILSSNERLFKPDQISTMNVYFDKTKTRSFSSMNIYHIDYNGDCRQLRRNRKYQGNEGSIMKLHNMDDMLCHGFRIYKYFRYFPNSTISEFLNNLSIRNIHEYFEGFDITKSVTEEYKFRYDGRMDSFQGNFSVHDYNAISIFLKNLFINELIPSDMLYGQKQENYQDLLLRFIKSAKFLYFTRGLNDASKEIANPFTPITAQIIAEHEQKMDILYHVLSCYNTGLIPDQLQDVNDYVRDKIHTYLLNQFK